MVVSGVPIRNGGEHAINIANMALDLLHESKLFVIPNMPNEPLKIRIGLHSGKIQVTLCLLFGLGCQILNIFFVLAKG